jgi:hypothetical protein
MFKETAYTAQSSAVIATVPIASLPPNFTLKLVRPGFGPAAGLPMSSQAPWRHGGCRSAGVAMQLLAGNRRAASASARGPGRTA